MNDNDFSCIKQVTETVYLTLPLKYTNNEIAGVTEILDGWKRQFVPKLQGVVVNYRNIRLKPLALFINSSKPATRYGVTATFDLFGPSIGDIVKGKVNRTSREHIGCLIEGTINATIHRPHCAIKGLSKFLRINRDILFQIDRFEFNHQTIRVNGQITLECVQLMEEHFPDVIDDIPEDILPNGLKNSVSNSDEDDGNSSTKSSSDESKFPINSTDLSNLNGAIKEEIETESDLHKNTSIGSSKSKKSKKRKRDSESPTPKTSKKRKKHKKLESVIEREIKSEPIEPVSRKKRKEKSTPNVDIVSSMLNADDLELTFAEFDSNILDKIKKEVKSPTKSSESKGKKRKHHSSRSDSNESLDKKKKHKSKDSKKSKKKLKDKKSKPSKTKGNLVASGDVLNKTKKKKGEKKKKEI